MIGAADDGTLILELYLLNDLLFEHNQTYSEHPQLQIIYVDCELPAVVLRALVCNYFQLIGVNNPKQYQGEVTKVYDDGSAKLRLSDRVGIYYI